MSNEIRIDSSFSAKKSDGVVVLENDKSCYIMEVDSFDIIQTKISPIDCIDGDTRDIDVSKRIFHITADEKGMKCEPLAAC